MKTTIKFISTIILAIAISSSTAFACGDQNNGTRACGDGGGGLIENQPTTTITKTNDPKEETILEMIKDFFTNIFS